MMPVGTPWVECAFVGVPMLVLQYRDDYEKLLATWFHAGIPFVEFTDGKYRGVLIGNGVLCVVPLSVFPLKVSVI